jgi:chromosome partitioning protein
VLSQAIAILNGKGGVGKTSITANIAGLAALAGYRVLAVDMDPQGNLGRDLGTRQRGLADGGKGLLDAVLQRKTAVPLIDVRPGLDVVSGGPELEELADVLHARKNRGAATYYALRDALAPIAVNYNLILVDTPPGERLLQTLALATAHFAVIPTKSDDGSVDGLERVSALFSLARDGDEQSRPVNPDLDLLGVVVFGVGTGSRRIRRETRNKVVTELGDDNLVFDGMIRHVEGPSRECRDRGVLAHELEATKLEALVARRGEDEDPHSTASGLAIDYQQLTKEVLERYAERMHEFATVGGAAVEGA